MGGHTQTPVPQPREVGIHTLFLLVILLFPQLLDRLEVTFLLELCLQGIGVTLHASTYIKQWQWRTNPLIILEDVAYPLQFDWVSRRDLLPIQDIQSQRNGLDLYPQKQLLYRT